MEDIVYLKSKERKRKYQCIPKALAYSNQSPLQRKEINAHFQKIKSYPYQVFRHLMCSDDNIYQLYEITIRQLWITLVATQYNPQIRQRIQKICNKNKLEWEEIVIATKTPKRKKNDQVDMVDQASEVPIKTNAVCYILIKFKNQYNVLKSYFYQFKALNLCKYISMEPIRSWDGALRFLEDNACLQHSKEPSQPLSMSVEQNTYQGVQKQQQITTKTQQIIKNYGQPLQTALQIAVKQSIEIMNHQNYQLLTDQKSIIQKVGKVGGIYLYKQIGIVYIDDQQIRNQQQYELIHKYMQSLILTLPLEDLTELIKLINIYRSIMLRLIDMITNLDKLRITIDLIISEAALYKLKRVKILTLPLMFQNAEELCNKLKIAFAKGRNLKNQRHRYHYVDNMVESCVEIIEKQRKAQEVRVRQIAQTHRVFQELSKHFHVVSLTNRQFYKTHPVSEEYTRQLLKQFNITPESNECLAFYVSFFIQQLLIPSRFGKVTPFRGQLLFCPIAKDLKTLKYSVWNGYLQFLSLTYPDWKNLGLCIDVIYKGQLKDHIVYMSYVKKTYIKQEMFLNKLTLIRDKVYQFQMYAYLQRLFKTRSGCNIEITVSNGLAIRIYLDRVVDRTQAYCSELMAVLMECLRPERFWSGGQDQPKRLIEADLTKVIQGRLEEIFVSRFFADKHRAEISQEVEIVRRHEGFPLQYRKARDKVPLQMKDLYKIIENQLKLII